MLDQKIGVVQNKVQQQIEKLVFTKQNNTKSNSLDKQCQVQQQNDFQKKQDFQLSTGVNNSLFDTKRITDKISFQSEFDPKKTGKQLKQQVKVINMSPYTEFQRTKNQSSPYCDQISQRKVMQDYQKQINKHENEKRRTQSKNKQFQYYKIIFNTDNFGQSQKLQISTSCQQYTMKKITNSQINQQTVTHPSNQQIQQISNKEIKKNKAIQNNVSKDQEDLNLDTLNQNTNISKEQFDMYLKNITNEQNDFCIIE